MNMTYKEIMPGMRLRVIESGRFETNCISVQFLSRSSDEIATSMALIPRILRRGTTKHPDMESLAAALDDMYGTRIEPVSRKYGDVSSAGFICDFVDMEEKMLTGAMKLLYEILLDPKTRDGAFLDEYTDGERANLVDEIKSEINNKMSYALRRTNECVFGNSPYAVNELGTEDTAECVDNKALFKFYKKMISSFPCEIFFCGNYSYDEVERAVLSVFKSGMRDKITKLSSNPPEYEEEKRVCERMDIAQASLIISMYTKEEDIYLSKLLSAVLGGGTSSKLFNNVREKESLCYSTGAMFDSFKKVMYMYAGIDPKNASKAEKAILREFKCCVDGDISEEEITNAKKAMIDDLLTTEDSVYAMEAFWLRSSLLGDERTPREVASAIKNADGQKIIDVAKCLVPSVTYLLTGMEGNENERKLLPEL